MFGTGDLGYDRNCAGGNSNMFCAISLAVDFDMMGIDKTRSPFKFVDSEFFEVRVIPVIDPTDVALAFFYQLRPGKPLIFDIESVTPGIVEEMR